MSGIGGSAQAIADEKGLVVKKPRSNELFIDIDDIESLVRFHRNLPAFSCMIIGFTRTPSPSGREGRYHIRVTLDRDVKSELERVAMQAVLGSDSMHEALSLAALQRGQEDVTVFFEKKEWPKVPDEIEAPLPPMKEVDF